MCRSFSGVFDKELNFWIIQYPVLTIWWWQIDFQSGFKNLCSNFISIWINNFPAPFIKRFLTHWSILSPVRSQVACIDVPWFTMGLCSSKPIVSRNDHKPKMLLIYLTFKHHSLGLASFYWMHITFAPS